MGGCLEVNSRRGQRQKHGDHRQHDPVVEAAFDVECLPNLDRDSRVAHDRLAERRIGRGKHCGQERCLPNAEIRKEQSRRDGPEDHSERKPDTEESGGKLDLGAEPGKIDPDGIGEQQQYQRGFRQHLYESLPHAEIEQVEARGTGQDADGNEQHGPSDQGGLQATTDQGVGQHEHCEECKRLKFHAPLLWSEKLAPTTYPRRRGGLRRLPSQEYAHDFRRCVAKLRSTTSGLL